MFSPSFDKKFFVIRFPAAVTRNEGHNNGMAASKPLSPFIASTNQVRPGDSKPWTEKSFAALSHQALITIGSKFTYFKKKVSASVLPPM